MTRRPISRHMLSGIFRFFERPGKAATSGNGSLQSIAARVFRAVAVVLVVTGLVTIAAIAVGMGMVWAGVVSPFSSFNEPRTSTKFPEVTAASYFFNDHYDDVDSNKNAFVGVAISGGGSRAALFSAEILFHLQQLGFLKHLTAVSSVSGGSVTAAYYALSTRDPERWPLSRMREYAAYDFRSALTRTHLNPASLFRLFATDYDRTDVLAEAFDRVMFKGAVFSNLDQFASQRDGRPHLFINASVFGASHGFVFQEADFASIGSRLDTYPLSRAVAASAAFPGLLNQSTLRDYAGDSRFVSSDLLSQTKWAEALRNANDPFTAYLRANLAKRDPKHVSGAVIDDLNWIIDDWAINDPEDVLSDRLLDTVRLEPEDRVRIQVARSLGYLGLIRGAARRLLEVAYPDALRPLAPRFLHLFDGGASDNLGWRTMKSAVYSYFDQAPKSAPASGCFIFLIDAHTERPESARTLSTDPREGIDRLLDVTSALDAVSSLMDQQRDQVIGDEIAGSVRQRGAADDETSAKPKQTWNCRVWHFGFHQLSVVPYQYVPKGEDSEAWVVRNADVVAGHRQLNALVNSVQTDFRLRGPKGCSVSAIQDAVADVARVLVFEDQAALTFARDWFQMHFGDIPALSAPPFPYRNTTRTQVVAEAGDGRIDTIECKS